MASQVDGNVNRMITEAASSYAFKDEQNKNFLNVFVSLPTRYGKSLCYQWAGLYMYTGTAE